MTSRRRFDLSFASGVIWLSAALPASAQEQRGYASNLSNQKNGCPKAFLDKGLIRITEQVRLQLNSAEIAAGKGSQEVLQAVLAVLKAHPEVSALRIEGHTDDRERRRAGQGSRVGGKPASAS